MKTNEGTITLMIPHQDLGIYQAKSQPELRQSQDQTRQFATWVRKTFPNILNEYRFVGKKRVKVDRGKPWSKLKTVNTDKHFVVYGLSEKDFLLIKMSWIFKQVPIITSINDRPRSGEFYYLDTYSILEPTPSLIARNKKKQNTKEAKTSL